MTNSNYRDHLWSAPGVRGSICQVCYEKHQSCEMLKGFSKKQLGSILEYVEECWVKQSWTGDFTGGLLRNFPVLVSLEMAKVWERVQSSQTS